MFLPHCEVQAVGFCNPVLSPQQPPTRPADSHAAGRFSASRTCAQLVSWLAGWQATGAGRTHEVQVYLPNQKLNPRDFYSGFLQWRATRAVSSIDTGTLANRAEIENPFDTSARTWFVFACQCARCLLTARDRTAIRQNLLVMRQIRDISRGGGGGGGGPRNSPEIDGARGRNMSGTLLPFRLPSPSFLLFLAFSFPFSSPPSRYLRSRAFRRGKWGIEAIPPTFLSHFELLAGGRSFMDSFLFIIRGYCRQLKNTIFRSDN